MSRKTECKHEGQNDRWCSRCGTLLRKYDAESLQEYLKTRAESTRKSLAEITVPDGDGPADVEKRRQNLGDTLEKWDAWDHVIDQLLEIARLYQALQEELRVRKPE
jgi:hypothetical protein